MPPADQHPRYNAWYFSIVSDLGKWCSEICERLRLSELPPTVREDLERHARATYWDLMANIEADRGNSKMAERFRHWSEVLKRNVRTDAQMQTRH